MVLASVPWANSLDGRCQIDFRRGMGAHRKRSDRWAMMLRSMFNKRPAVTRAIVMLIAAGNLIEMRGKMYDRSFTYQIFINQSRIGTELERR